MINKKIVLVIILFVAISMVVATAALADDNGLEPIEELGEFLYFDENLSEPAGQSCASCHEPTTGFVDPDSNIPVSEGVIPGLFGGRNSPMSAYAMYAPIFYFDDEEGLWIGGQFWDGRATGYLLGDPLADQAEGPFLNPVEMDNDTEAQVLDKVEDSLYYEDYFKPVCGEIDLTDSIAVEASYDCMALAIAAFERTALFGQFTSKYDAYLQDCLALLDGELGDPGVFDSPASKCARGEGDEALAAGAIFSKKEWQGLQLFMDDAQCSACHVADWVPVPVDTGLPVHVPDWAPTGFAPPVFTDFSYDNLGVPKSKHKLLRDNPIDHGLGAFLCTIDPELIDPELIDLSDCVTDEYDTEYYPAEDGKFKVMPLRNIADTAPYAHNGFFLTLENITHFYNTRDVKNWDPPEVSANVNVGELGDLGLKGSEEQAVVRFMQTLSDGYVPK